MSKREQRLQAAVKKLAPYYGLTTTKELARFDSLLENFSSRRTETDFRDAALNTAEVDPVTRKLVELLIDTTDGAYTTATLAQKLSEELTGALPDIIDRFKKLFYISGDSDAAENIRTISNISGRPARPIQTMLGESRGSINLNPNNPNKTTPGLSIIVSNSKRIAQTQRYANACSIFLNGIPNLELAKAVPFVNIEFHFPRAPFDESGRLQAPGLLKYLFGAIRKEDGSPLELIARANSTQVSRRDEEGEIADYTYSVGGMEIFTSPQTLINADETSNNPDIRANPVLDKFRPMATLKEFSVNVVSTTGLNSFKSAKLEFVLHDRSRLSEIADFIRPDLYGLNEMMIEYGWSHPDGENDLGNLYGDLINGMRIKEMYGVQNASYTFDDSGQVNVTLQLYTKGASDLSTEIISSAEDLGIADVIRQIRDLQDLVSSVRQRIFPQDTTQREVRGLQVLDVAQDALANSVLTKEVRKEIVNFRRNLASREGGPRYDDYQKLIKALDDLVQADQLQGGGGGNRRQATPVTGGAVGRLRTNILSSITQKVEAIKTTGTQNDPFFVPEFPPDFHRGGVPNGRLVAQRQQDSREVQARQSFMTNFNVGVESGAKVSLAKLLLHFIGVPLAATKKFDDIQFVFYPFNAWAGFASALNIASFEVDLQYFAQELARYRLDNISRSANMSLREFLSFVAQTLLDDPAARSYGLWDNTGALYKQVFDENGRTRETTAVNEVPELQRRTEQRLTGVTPDGSFRMPKIDFYLECLPEKLLERDGQNIDSNNSKNVLRIHVFDAQCSAYETVGSILASARTAKIESIGTYSQGPTTDVTEETRRIAAEYREKAVNSGLLELIPNTSPETYRIKGGSRALKEFVYKTVPYIIYGAAGTLIKVANLSSIQDPALSTVNLLRSFRKSEIEPNGELPGGLPMRIIPATLNISSYGCPLIAYTQQFFVDFQTGTTADNIYAVVGLSHKIAEGEFTTDISLVAPTDAYGVYESFTNQVFNALQTLRDFQGHTQEAQLQGQTPVNSTQNNG